MEKELEVKILGLDVDMLEEKIIKLGGVLLADEYQVNTLIDSYDKPIKTYLDAYLRIRETKDFLSGHERVVLTLKENIKSQGIRENEEFNVGLEDKETLFTILKKLGFDNIRTGYKHRKSYKLLSSRIDIDTWDKDTYPKPYIEVEVKDKKDLENLLSLLEIDEDNISTLSIVELREKLNVSNKDK